ncbi:hypothetical protein [Klebsiella sp. WOUb02]|uniref:hypothetical protein n=1 Tax=Klebsiella sp. WOUb02 TaxID=3161071 RepID=UPI003D06AE12
MAAMASELQERRTADSEPAGYDNIEAIELAVESLKETIIRARRFRYCQGSLMNLSDEVALLKKRKQ